MVYAARNMLRRVFVNVCLALLVTQPASIHLDFLLIPHPWFSLFVGCRRLPRLAVRMSSSSGPNRCGPEFRDLSPFPVSRYICGYNSCLDVRLFAVMYESGVALAIRDRNNATPLTSVKGWVKRWLHCGGRGMYFSGFVRTPADMPFVCSLL